MSFTKRTEKLVPEGAYQVLARAGELETQGRSVIHLEIGQPDYDTPQKISLKGIQAIANGYTKYRSTAGIEELRAVIPAEDLAHIAAAAQAYDCWVLSDEIYTRIVFDGRSAPSIAALPGMAERTIIMDGFTKTYAMTGWRLGYGIMPEPLARKVQLLLTHTLGSTAHFTQIAGVEALVGTQAHVADMVAQYEARRDVIVAGLNAIPGVTCRKPQGAFYVFPNVQSFGVSSAELANRLLEKGGVALLPGTAFGAFGEGFLRLSYANSIENIQEALRRITAVLGSGL
jgi:aspartate aminotransferase